MTTGPSEPAGGTYRTGDPAGAPPTRGPAGVPVDPGDASVGEIVGQVSHDLSLLVRQEIELAKAELRQEAEETGRAAAGLGGAGFAAAMVLVFVSCALWWGVAEVIAPGWAALLVAAVWLVVGIPLYLSGRDRFRALHPTPKRTRRTPSTVPDALRGR